MTTNLDDATTDPYLWLEDVEGEQSMEWVKGHNARTQHGFDSDGLRDTAARTCAAFDSTDRIVPVVQRGDHFYNVWKDAEHPRGLWRRTTPSSYRSGEPEWETLLDIDALGAEEGVNWVWHGSTWDTGTSTRCLIALSRGGADADVVREFDLPTKSFVADGFELPESKGGAVWLDENTLLIDRDFGPGTMSDAGYPLQLRLWRRGEPLAETPIVLENVPSGPFIGASVQRSQGFEYVVLRQAIDFYDSQYFLRRHDELIPIDIPQDAGLDTFGDQLIVWLRTEWLGFVGGSVIAMPFEGFLRGERAFTALFAPTDRSALEGWTHTAGRLVLTVIDNVRTRLEVLTHSDGEWQHRHLSLPTNGTAHASPLDAEAHDLLHITVTDTITPATLLEVDLADPDAMATVLKSAPNHFDADDLELIQLEAASADGTLIPYTVAARAGLALDGSHPTVLYGYGGFQISLMPEYSAGVGIGWLEQGGVYAVANLRGGGEFGPDWHAAGRKENHQNCFDDFIAVAEDLIRRGYTSADRLGISGGSNGGLLVGATMVQRPDLFRAVSCAVPLLDMRRYHLLLAGQSWMAEYGDPDNPDEWAYISEYSPYQRVSSTPNYPAVLFTTSMRDDRVHPGHARKMMAKMAEFGHDVHFYENIEGGHGGAADNEQLAYRIALSFEFFRRYLIADAEPGITDTSQ
jgi:prolyl oligopeptidase